MHIIFLDALVLTRGVAFLGNLIRVSIVVASQWAWSVCPYAL